MRDGRIGVGDRVTHVNDQACEEWPIKETLKHIIGPCGSSITFTGRNCQKSAHSMSFCRQSQHTRGRSTLRDSGTDVSEFLTVIHQGSTHPVRIELIRGTPIYWHFMDIIHEKDQEIARLKRMPDDLLHAGIGITFDKSEKAHKAVVRAVLKDGSAWRDGRIAVDDQILKIDGKDSKDMTLDEMIGVIIGPYGTPIVLTVQKHNTQEKIEVPLVRGSPVYWYFFSHKKRMLPFDF